jgi:dienelactone hydrolase
LKPIPACSLLAVLFAPAAFGQATTRVVTPLLTPPLHRPEVVDYQIRKYALTRMAKFAVPASKESWTKQAAEIRRRVLDEVVFHGWSPAWRDSPLKFEDLGYLPGGKGYRMRKLRYEIVPGMQTTAILYEPEQLTTGMPAMLNVNGHDLPGKAVEYKQKRCINFALQGMLALSPEWFFMGELRQPENTHWFAAHIDQMGLSSEGVFYLAMRKGLDYLYQHPNVDRSRIGVTGLSGGGWQSMFLAALDERIALTIPVSGYYSAELAGGDSRLGDNEQTPPDIFAIADYSHLTAMFAPRPSLLIHSADDQCCFRAPVVKPYIYDRVRPFFSLYGADDRFAWHENTDPGDHNYQAENRMMAYRFIARHFGLPAVTKEVPVDDQVRSVVELSVGLPADNLTLLGLARKLAASIDRQPVPAEGASRTAWQQQQRDRLRRLVRFQPVTVERAWMLGNSKAKGLESYSYRFDFSNELSATAVRLKAIAAEPRTATIILNDSGRKASADAVCQRMNRGEWVVALDLLFNGDAAPTAAGYPSFDRLLTSVSDRPAAMRAAQLLAISRWMKAEAPSLSSIRIESTGIRSQVAALVAAAAEPGSFSELLVYQGLPSVRAVLDLPIRYENVPEVFCPGLSGEFDLDRLAAIAAPTRYALLDQFKPDPAKH